MKLDDEALAELERIDAARRPGVARFEDREFSDGRLIFGDVLVGGLNAGDETTCAIVAAVNALGPLVAEVRRLRAVIATVDDQLRDLDSVSDAIDATYRIQELTGRER